MRVTNSKARISGHYEHSYIVVLDIRQVKATNDKVVAQDALNGSHSRLYEP